MQVHGPAIAAGIAVFLTLTTPAAAALRAPDCDSLAVWAAGHDRGAQ